MMIIMATLMIMTMMMMMTMRMIMTMKKEDGQKDDEEEDLPPIEAKLLGQSCRCIDHTPKLILRHLVEYDYQAFSILSTQAPLVLGGVLDFPRISCNKNA